MKKQFAVFLFALFFAQLALAQSGQIVQLRVSVVWSDGKRLTDNDQQPTPDVSSNQREASGGQNSTNPIVNMDIRVAVIGDSGATVAESSPDGEGNAIFNVEGSVQTSSGIGFPAYRIRVFGSEIDEEWVENVRPGQGERMITVRIHKKGQKNNPGGGIVAANALKIPKKAEKEFQKGQKAFLKNKLPEARDHFQRAVSIYPQYDAAFNALGVVLMKLGDAAAGRKAFEQAVAANDKFAPAYVNLARIMAGENKFDDAALSLMRSLSLEPLNPEALSMLCQFDVLRGKYDDVPALAQKLHSIPHDGQALCHFAAGNALEHLNRPTEAIVEYMLFMKEDPTNRLSANAKESVDRIRQQQNQAKAE